MTEDAQRRSVFDDPEYFPKDVEQPDIDDYQDNAPALDRYIAFGLDKNPVQLQIMDEYGIIYQPSCLHLESVILITSHWLGLGFGRTGFILHGQLLHKMLTPLQKLKVGWVHAYREDAHAIDFLATDRSDELDVYGVIVTSITRYAIDQYEAHLQDMLNKHRSETQTS